MNLALFDFDGTITDRDTFADFILYTHGRLRFILGLFNRAPLLLLYIMGAVPNWRAKESFFGYFYRGWDIERFIESASLYSRKRIDEIARPRALDAIDGHKYNGDAVAVVSASPEHWIKPWCDARGIFCMGTRLEVSEGRLTGRIAGKNCYGPEKVRRIEDRFNLGEYQSIYAYGDSSGDKEMLALADVKFYKWRKL